MIRFIAIVAGFTLGGLLPVCALHWYVRRQRCRPALRGRGQGAGVHGVSSVAHEIIEFYQGTVEYRGMLQGLIHSLFKEAAPPYFTLRDFASRDLVRCEFKAADWPSLHQALTKDGVVLVAGWLRVKRVDKAIEVMRVDKIQGTKAVSEEELRSFFGSAPGWTGDMTTDEFIKSVRVDDDGDDAK